jgi:hypothetical protein
MKDIASRKVWNSKDASTFDPLTDQSGRDFNPASISDFESILCFVIVGLLDYLSHLHKSLYIVYRKPSLARAAPVDEFILQDPSSFAIMAHVRRGNNDNAPAFERFRLTREVGYRQDAIKGGPLPATANWASVGLSIIPKM